MKASFKLILLIVCLNSAVFAAEHKPIHNKSSKENKTTPTATTAIKMPAGFNSTVIAEGLGKARHLVVNSNGDVYVKLDRLKGGKGIIVIKPGQSANAAFDGFGNYTGTGITIKNGYLYASSNTTVYRYKMDNKSAIPTAKPETIVTGLEEGQHPSKSLVIDNNGNLYVNQGAPSNSCQVQDRTKGSLGIDPCPIIDYAAGIWQYKADKQNQTLKQGVHYASGIRNVVGMDWNSSVNQLFGMQHGRDQLHDNWPDMYTDEESAELPAEEMLMIKQNSNFGWPYCYFDQNQNKKILAPEYGGNKTTQGRCAGVDVPVIAFPGHMAPDGLLFYTGNKFPARYKNGAFIAFHGSWNRAPLNQKGFFVAFVPFKDGKPSGPYEVFAEGFAGKKDITSPGQAEHRPCGLAQGPDGSLYVSDDSKGTIWKINYTGK